MKHKLSVVLVVGLLVAIVYGTVAAKPSPVSNTITYQGYLEYKGQPADGIFDFVFTLYDLKEGGDVHPTSSVEENTPVEDGLFTVELNFGDAFTKNTQWWLEIEVRPDGGGLFDTLDPRQRITAAPYASYALHSRTTDPHNHWGDTWTGTGAHGLKLHNTSGTGAYYGLKVVSDSIHGVGVHVDSQNIGIYGRTYSTSSNDAGVYGMHAGASGSSAGVYGYSASSGGYGVHGYSSFIGVKGTSTADSGGRFDGDEYGIEAYASAPDGKGALLRGKRYGVTAQSVATSPPASGFNAGILASDYPTGQGYAGYFDGDVHVQGAFSKTSSTFMIDHPIDPSGKYLFHAAVESPDMKNVYDGVVSLDENGEAWVTLPDYFEVLNRDFRYQLTSIGAPGPNLYIAEEIKGNQFKIAGGEANIKVSWMVTGIRQDAWANANRVQVEVEKQGYEVGTYLHPEAHGVSETLDLNYQLHQEMMAEMEDGSE